MTSLDIIDQVPEIARLISLELRRYESPYADEISQNEAFRRYGRAWVEKHLEQGALHPKTKGGKKVYSLSEIERTMAKDRAASQNVKLIRKGRVIG